MAITVDDENPPYAFALAEGEATVMDVDHDEKLKWSTQIAGRYMDEDLAEAFECIRILV